MYINLSPETLSSQRRRHYTTHRYCVDTIENDEDKVQEDITPKHLT